MSHAARHPIHILLVEDNPGDVELTLKALHDGKLRNTITVVTDGEEAMAYLRGGQGHERATRPDLVLLDLNLPKMDGREVLQAIKDDPALREIPVVVLTSSAAERDILESYRLQANCYITKPVDLDQFFDVVRALEQFWFEVVQLPG
jgi:two-component system, chemotaxis family, response regulator Rcp1